ncbi:MAG: hypothetical protein A3A96_03675 [Candidatus Zambryskibacteria bacterium RIFCSPLOWO2_01_FULL_39_39]|uniref:Uncharacterized protein n=1 Tax=Candidatus Zambryskibacteria bacterium RIFCSPLOWO2_01_FULL_39_39 TaxID=1802758 RepID=A0A1G2TXQ1_9BACT|nr:MAG: hypothetical protein A2644_00940 [Candidatus Zambryskibacteria bacterium RIFCSPHIGHO2_01_FULL_39_63]OHA94593.1 MAG: hypothetical protein A3B88_00070 [Candidatus Zambryskibacteria bacterium RIFCSPHIGHO2_02_FULL_39_19]OHA98631.1 MAG: hypothetical protein A3F20_00025 [Candidatus Zambryskibacteria bacterium RIFCSPHIGHO2_12_FULL_39_21]OHB02076.1 MAG: hypothetical protein A3A96_03675 [Candidatus Zambryskibacteria bacterium RIFCSPLOWO2_01_FULL_39_39]
MNNRILIIIFTIVVFILGGLLYIYNPDPIKYTNPNQTEPVACTMDAKLCPDGSYVGRTGPNCEFLCPAEDLCEGGKQCPTIQLE